MVKNQSKYFSFKEKKYAFNLEVLKKVCLSSLSDVGNKECEITQVYESDNNGDFGISSKVEHEIKSFGNSQNDMIVYDVVKLLIVTLLERNEPESDFLIDIGTSISLNTLISWGVLEEIIE